MTIPPGYYSPLPVHPEAGTAPYRYDFPDGEAYVRAWHIWTRQVRDCSLNRAESEVKLRTTGEHMGLHPDVIEAILDPSDTKVDRAADRIIAERRIS